MRLIDADAFKQQIAAITVANGYDPKIPNLLCELIDLQPAAYDMDQVARDSEGGGWISVSERLPNIEECQTNDCRFIVTDGNRRYQAWFDYENGYFDKCECNGLGLKKDNCVIAWQSLPEEYREEAAK